MYIVCGALGDKIDPGCSFCRVIRNNAIILCSLCYGHPDPLCAEGVWVLMSVCRLMFVLMRVLVCVNISV